MSKAEKTKAFIIETVAPIFNKNGFSAMSLSKITMATGLTKGAIYGHFENKEELALEAFRFSVRRLLKDLNTEVNKGDTPFEKLIQITSFYDKYYQYIKNIGGCPILNTGADANDKNIAIANLVKTYNHKILEQFELLLEKAKESKELKENVDVKLYAKRFFYMIEGAVYMSYIMKEESYIKDASLFMKQILMESLKQ